MNESFNKDIEEIKERNKKVEADKAWEVSWTRKLFICFVTYFIAAFWMHLIGESGIWLKACVPTGGYLLSTLSIPFLKKIWIDKVIK